MSTDAARAAAIKYALDMGKVRKHYASGGVVGPLHGTEGGRTDTLPISVPSGSYVLPADVVSGIPGAEGNTLAGHNLLGKLFTQTPFAPDKAPYGAAPAGLKPGRGTIPGQTHAEHELLQTPRAAAGGEMGADGEPPVDIMAAGGEFVVPPEVVKHLGGGDMKKGHELLDDFVLHIRKENIKTLKKLPGPAKK